MKILMVAVFHEKSTNISQAEAFQRMGVKVIPFDYRKRAKETGNIKRDWEIVHTCRNEKPDFVFFSKCNEVSTFVVRKCNRICPTVLWYMDPLNINFNKRLIRKINHCTLTFCALVIPYYEAKKYSNTGRVYFLQEGFDPKRNYAVDVPYKYDVSFIGSLRGKRKIYHEKIGFHVYNNVYGESHSYAVGETKINLNFTEKGQGASDRVYKVLASKGFLLTNPWEEMEKDFVIGRDLDIFTSPEEIKNKITFYLDNKSKREKIAYNGFKTVQKFSRDFWAQEIINKVNNLISR